MRRAARSRSPGRTQLDADEMNPRRLGGLAAVRERGIDRDPIDSTSVGTSDRIVASDLQSKDDQS